MTSSPTLAQRLIRDGIPPSLLIDLVDPEGMKAALAAELLESDVARTEWLAQTAERTARSA
jgi:hypothetical protein